MEAKRCDDCNGTAVHYGVPQPERCKSCHGNGFVIASDAGSNEFYLQKITCNTCDGAGLVEAEEEKISFDHSRMIHEF